MVRNAVNKDLNLNWFRKYDRLIDPSNGISDTKWFIGGKCNIVANAIDRHVKSQPDKIAYIFENPNKATRKVSHRKLAYEVNILACALKEAGVKKGDAVGIYTLRILATTGEVINKEAWNWYFENIG